MKSTNLAPDDISNFNPTIIFGDLNYLYVRNFLFNNCKQSIDGMAIINHLYRAMRFYSRKSIPRLVSVCLGKSFEIEEKMQLGGAGLTPLRASPHLCELRPPWVVSEPTRINESLDASYDQYYQSGAENKITSFGAAHRDFELVDEWLCWGILSSVGLLEN